MTAIPSGSPRAVQVPPPWAYRRYWLRDLAAIGALAAAIALLFGVTDLDLRIARWFFAGGSAAVPFPAGLALPWSALYRFAGAPMVAAALYALGVLSGWMRFRAPARRRREAQALLLALLLGPGLLVNMVLKDYWGRPRPVQTAEFGGRLTYQDAWTPGVPGRGKSFPCGHSSAGYVFSILFFLYRRRNARMAYAWLAFSVVYGTALGIGRVAAGAHFASDVAGSAVAVLLVNVLVYYFLLNLPGHEDGATAGAPLPVVTWRTYAVYAAFAAVVFAGSLLATPHHRDLDDTMTLPASPTPPALRVWIDGDRVRLVFHDRPVLEVRSEYEGFGSFNARVRGERDPAGGDGATILYRLRRTGWFTEFDHRARIVVPSQGLSALDLELALPGGLVEIEPGPPPSYPVRLRLPGGAVGIPDDALWRREGAVVVDTSPASRRGR